MAGYMWDPYAELKRIEERMNRMFAGAPGHNEVPNVDVQEHDNNVIVTADVPGVDKNDIKINVRNGNILEISAQKRTEQEQKNAL